MLGFSIDDFKTSRSTLLKCRKPIVEIFNTLETPNFRHFDPLDILCPSDKCIVEKDNKILYYDDDHINRSGAMLFTESIIKLLDGNSHKPN